LFAVIKQRITKRKGERPLVTAYGQEAGNQRSAGTRKRKSHWIARGEGRSRKGRTQKKAAEILGAKREGESPLGFFDPRDQGKMKASGGITSKKGWGALQGEKRNL